jgi:hypothetical protein
MPTWVPCTVIMRFFMPIDPMMSGNTRFRYVAIGEPISKRRSALCGLGTIDESFYQVAQLS